MQEAVAILIQTQAAFVSEMAEINRRYNELAAERKQVEAELRQAILALDHRLANVEHILRDLPEAIRQKIGFKNP
jgi:hypothetical protein